MKNYLAITACMLLLGCASTGNNYDENKVSAIKKGETTEPELVAMFGKPTQRGVNSDGETILQWSYSEARAKGESFIPFAGPFIGGMNTSQKQLDVTIGKDGRVSSFKSTAGANELRENQTQDAPKAAK